MNKKQLSGLLISVLAFYSENINAMEKTIPFYSANIRAVEKNIRRNKSAKMGSRTQIEGTVIACNKKLLKERKQGIGMYSGAAYSDLIQKYDILERSSDICMKHGLTPQHFVESAGHVGAILKCRLKGTDKIFAVKFEPYPEKTGIVTENNNTAHVDDRKRELQFYKDTKTLWKDKKWATKLYDRFEDKNGVYTVTDWVEGETLASFCKKMKNKPLKEKLKQAYNIGTQINKIIDDFENAGKMNTDMHADNLMIEKNGNVRVVDHGKYFNISDLRNQNIDMKNAFLIAMRFLTSLLNLNNLRIDHQDYEDFGYSGLRECKNKDDKFRNAYIYATLIKNITSFKKENNNTIPNARSKFLNTFKQFETDLNWDK